MYVLDAAVAPDLCMALPIGLLILLPLCLCLLPYECCTEAEALWDWALALLDTPDAFAFSFRLSAMGLEVCSLGSKTLFTPTASMIVGKWNKWRARRTLL